VSFSRFNKLRLRGWLREKQDNREAMPSKRSIALRLEFGSEALVDDILREMADEGMITLHEIPFEAMGEARGTIPHITVPDLAEEVSNRAPKVRTQNTQGASGTARKAPSAASSGAAKRITDRAPSNRPASPPPADPSPAKEGSPASPEPVAEAPPLRAPEAAAHGIERGPDHPMAVAFERGRKPRIEADVIRAAKAKSVPLDQFVSDLIKLGFAQWCRLEAVGETR
jgi:hypothetical protein